eukprot:TRINITY_DN647_c0_g1_i1.p1 TRINITY_DN647_c0_g1~~TRINITY_DN647_c0_g1_i1.p1  ORF type:complete len:296 (+),score=49.26 TRINITY_DN647_c0_g1_i1:185-1072(+)
MGSACRKPTVSLTLSSVAEVLSVDMWDAAHQTFDAANSVPIKAAECITSLGILDVYTATLASTHVMLFRFNAKCSLSSYAEKIPAALVAMAKLEHPCILPIMAACLQPPGVCYITIGCSLGSLDTFLKSKQTHIPPKKRPTILLQITEAIDYLHSQTPEICHLNLKPSTVWIESKWKVYVTDFGFEQLRAEFRTQSLTTESNAYRDPTLFMGIHPSKESDVFSIGMLMWELWTRKTPFEGLNSLKVGGDMVSGVRPQDPADCPQEYLNLMKACWALEKNQRPTIPEILKRLKAMA